MNLIESINAAQLRTDIPDFRPGDILVLSSPIGHELGKLREIGKGRPSMLQSMGLQRVRHDLATEQQQFLPYDPLA